MTFFFTYLFIAEGQVTKLSSHQSMVYLCKLYLKPVTA